MEILAKFLLQTGHFLRVGTWAKVPSRVSMPDLEGVAVDPIAWGTSGSIGG